MDRWAIAPNLALDQAVARRRAEGESIVHLGFGESRLPVFPALVDRLVAGARRNAYGPVVGDELTRAAVAGYFSRRGVPTDATQVIVSPGSKALLMALQLVVPGDTVIAKPSWLTYAPQVELAGKRAWRVPIPPECGGIPEPAALRDAIQAVRKAGREISLVVLTVPDNPTGTTAPPELIRQLCAIAAEENLLIVCDEIYRDMAHDPGLAFLSPAEVEPERTVVLTGLSKSLALGGWRIGAARFPTGPSGRRLSERVAAVASEVWSALAGPMQAVAEYAFSEPPELCARRAADARLHGAVAAAVYAAFTDGGAVARPPTAGFYCYPDFDPLRQSLASRGVVDSLSLQHFLLDEFGIAVLSGHYFGDDERALRFRAATSMLYGDTEHEQRLALEAADPLLLPHISTQLSRIIDAMAEIGSIGGYPVHDRSRPSTARQ